MTNQKLILEFYSQPDTLTSFGKHAPLLERLPDDIESLTRVVQRLVIHEFVASPFYGVTVPDRRRSESQAQGRSKSASALASSNSPVVILYVCSYYGRWSSALRPTRANGVRATGSLPAAAKGN